MEIHIILFLSIIVFCFAMSVIGIWRKIPMMMFIGGALIAFIAVMTDSIDFGSTLEVVVDSTVYSADPESIPFTEYPKILFALIGSVTMIGGGLIWKGMET